jgi:hypothetical protein
MAFSRHAMDLVPQEAHGLVEDAEHGIALGLAGVRVHYAHDARVLGEMPASGDAARSQRARWEDGRRELQRRMVPTLARAAWRGSDRVAADLAVDLCVPPLGQLVTAQVAGTVFSVAAGAALRHATRPAPVGAWRSPLVWGAGLAGVAVHVARGWQASGTGIRGLADLAKAPVYVGWKLAGKIRRQGPQAPGSRNSDGASDTWVRTKRESERER